MAESHIVGCILGTAVGDAIGLPYEGLSRRRGAKMFGPPDKHRFFFGRGMVSDDTEHTCMVAQALIASGSDLDVFRRQLAWRFRFWLLSLPAGTGRATLLAILRLWIGFRPQKSGVHSAGNGPAMRAAILGAAVDDLDLLCELVRASTRITHTDPKAEYGALAVALAAQMVRREKTVSGSDYLAQLRSVLAGKAEKLVSLITEAVQAAEESTTTLQFAESLGLGKGVSGYVYHSVPVAIHAWLTHRNDFSAAVTAVIECGGDTDSTAAIVGGIIGTAVGKEGIPALWLNGIWEWPRSRTWMEKLGAQLARTIRTGTAERPIRLAFIGILPRNIFFLIVVLFHILRRLLPPY